MRICHVVEAGGGVGQVVIDLVRSGTAKGDDITVIYARARAEPHFVQALSPLLGPKFIPVSMRRRVGLHDIPDGWNLYRCLRRAGPFDVIHGHSSKAGALVRIIGRLFPRSAKVYSPHAFVTLDPKSPCIYGAFEKILSWFGGTIVTLSAVEKEHALKKLRLNPKKIVTIPNGIEIDYTADRAAARQVMQYQPSQFVVGFVGRFVPQKNPVRLIEAFALALEIYPSLQLAIIGDGPLRTEMDAALEAKQLTDKVCIFSGYKGRDLMPGFDCLMCSSDYEGFPIIFLEALAAGVPIFTTPVGGAHESVLEGETGFVATDFSAESLADALGKMVALGPMEREKMADRARQHVKKFSLERVAGQMHTLYRHLIDQKQRRS